MKAIKTVGAMILVWGIGAAAHAETTPLVVTSSNEPVNQLLVFDATGALVQKVPTQGAGGVSVNAGGIAVRGRMVAAVNFGSGSVSLLERSGDTFAVTQVIAATSSPVSVAFGKDHLYVLGTTTVESHRLDGSAVDPAADGIAGLVHADGSSAQVGVTGDELVVTEKSNVVETVALNGGAVTGAARAVAIPANSDTPFGLITRGANAYVTIAHSDEIALVKQDAIRDITATGTPGGDGQHSPCWLAILGPYLYSANSPSRTISRLVATGTQIIVDKPVAATTLGSPTDITAADKRLAVVDVSADGSRVTQFSVGDGGELTQVARTAVAAPINGIGIVVE